MSKKALRTGKAKAGRCLREVTAASESCQNDAGSGGRGGGGRRRSDGTLLGFSLDAAQGKRYALLVK